MQGWNIGDMISLAIGGTFCLAVSLLRRTARNRDSVIQNFSTGIAIGPIALILFSPLGAVLDAYGHGHVDLLKIATEQGRVTLVFAAFIAAIYLVDSSLPGRNP